MQKYVLAKSQGCLVSLLVSLLDAHHQSNEAEDFVFMGIDIGCSK